MRSIDAHDRGPTVGRMVTPTSTLPMPRWGSVQTSTGLRGHYFTALEYGRLLAVCGFSPRADRVGTASAARCSRCERQRRGAWGLRGAPHNKEVRRHG